MTPQSSFMYAAPIQPGREADLRALLAGMNLTPGILDPRNPLIPFGQFPQLHFARVLVVTDLAAADRPVYNLPPTGLPDYLVFVGEIDGEEGTFQAELLASAAHNGLGQLFSHCVGFTNSADLGQFLSSSRVTAAAQYVNWVGRTVEQVREEDQLRRHLEDYIGESAGPLRQLDPQQQHATLRSFVQQQQRTGALTLTPPAPTPLRWQLAKLLDLIFVPLVLLILSPLLLLYLPIFLIQLRHWEKTDPAIAPPLDPAHAADLLDMENYDVTNQFSVFGSLKPGRTRLWSLRFFLWITNYAARHLYTRGGLARISTIHFARWVLMDGGQRMLFFSIYDGSLESYMDDFVNKVGFGLNITFSNGIGYPRTRWLLFDGCKNEQVYKRVLRRHQLPTDVWYSAHPGLTAANKHRNMLIREGIERPSMSDGEIRDWLALL